MKKVVSLAVMAMLMISVSMGYTVSIQTTNGTTVREAEAGAVVKLGLGDRTSAEYTVETGNAVLKVVGNKREMVMPEGNVEITVTRLCTVSFESNGGSYVSRKIYSVGDTYGTLSIPKKNGHIFGGWYLDSGLSQAVTGETEVTQTSDHTLYAKWQHLEVGSYIAYQPTDTECIVSGGDSGTGIDQVYNPSSITAWKVLYNETEDDHIKIISAESVGDLTLTGKTGYIHAIDVLNRMCSEYVDSTYATEGRCLGYNAGEGTIDEALYPITWENTYTNGNKGFPYTDSQNAEDIRLMNTADGEEYPLRVSGTVWLASRNLYTYGDYSSFGVRSVAATGTVNYNRLYQSNSVGSSTANSPVCGVRPVISLKSDIHIVGGDGTSDNPYQISI